MTQSKTYFVNKTHTHTYNVHSPSAPFFVDINQD